MYSGKPIIGLSGGIGAGKTFVGSVFVELGCLVIDSDALVRQAYLDPDLKQILREWWGDSIFTATGAVDRPSVGKKIFDCENDRLRLERMLHPRVAKIRESRMAARAVDPGVVAFIWDSPLLFETRLSQQCDATVFVEATEALRLNRLWRSRGWDAAELARREKSQMPLDKKRAMSDYVVVNTADAGSIRVQIRELLTRILAGASRRPTTGRATPD
jgi:dephospho-CoA kinase